jgi:hypothetical protein
MESAGRIIDGSAFVEKQIALYRALENDGNAADMELAVMENKEGQQSILISVNKFPMMKIRGSMPDVTGNFYLTSQEYLSGNVHGWNEFTLELLGAGNLFLREEAVMVITEEIETVQITAGRIHRYDTRITGSDALAGLRNRRERVTALVEWMFSMEAPSRRQTLKEFEKYWKPVLFPEMVSKSKRPYGWQQEGDIYIKAEDIRWNTGYTDRTFKEELKPVRNSGTLLRDWEEAISWIYLEYEWENIVKLLSQEITFTKIK